MLILHTFNEKNCIKANKIPRVNFEEHRELPFTYDLSIILTSKRGIVSLVFIKQNLPF